MGLWLLKNLVFFFSKVYAFRNSKSSKREKFFYRKKIKKKNRAILISDDLFLL